ncbi:MAG: hypothetical protein PUC12_10305 [Clostridiales bacterium]|nr:hypothetical protein [Clostridiales bacterium]
MKRAGRYISILLFFMILCFMTPIKAEASVVVSASGDESGEKDYRQIMNALATERDIVLEEGKTYYIKGTLWVNSNQSITATGATIISKSGAFRNHPTKANYGSLNHFTVDGGTWKNEDKNGYQKSMVQFSHGSNILIKNATIYCNYKGHAVEIIACKNVTVDNCKLKAVGKCSSDCVEEQLQIDIATPVTAPTVADYGKEFVNGQTCQNITVKNCTITGGRGVCANFASKEKKFQTKFHKNVVLKNNTITGVSSEAVALFNVLGATVENNKIVCKSKRTNTAYSVGLHIAMFGKAPSGMKKAVYKVNNNTIKGGRQGFYVYSHSSSRFGKVIAKKNKCYAKAGKDKAIQVTEAAVSNKTLSNNKQDVWK